MKKDSLEYYVLLSEFTTDEADINYMLNQSDGDLEKFRELFRKRFNFVMEVNEIDPKTISKCSPKSLLKVKDGVIFRVLN